MTHTPKDADYSFEDSERYQQLVQEMGFTTAPPSTPTSTYRDSALFQRMMEENDLVELPNGQIVEREIAQEKQTSRLLQRIGAITRMGCAECLREKLGAQRPIQEIAKLILKVRYEAAMAEIYEPSPELIEDASLLEQLVQQARGRANPKYALRNLAVS